jgi:hypothetical protein
MNYDQYHRMLKLRKLSVEEKRKLIFEWVKTNKICLREFQDICNELEDNAYTLGYQNGQASNLDAPGI